MSHTLPTAGELRNMPPDELAREVRAARATVAKMRMEIHLKKEKDTARYRREKRQLARMLTVIGGQRGKIGQIGQKEQAESLKQKPKKRTLSAPRKRGS